MSYILLSKIIERHRVIPHSTRLDDTKYIYYITDSNDYKEGNSTHCIRCDNISNAYR